MAEWSEIECLERKLTLYIGSHELTGDDTRKGKYIVGMSTDTSGVSLQVTIRFIASCDTRIVKISATSLGQDLDIHPLGSIPDSDLVFHGSEEKIIFNRSGFLNDVTLNIEYQLRRNCNHFCAERERQRSQSLLAPLAFLEKLFSSTDSSDVIFEVGGTEIKAHKLILSARYDYFKTMFSSGMKESTTNRVKVENYETETFREVLRFVYRSTLPDDFQTNAASYLPIAEHYGMDDLKTSCVEAMKKSLNAGNILQYLSLAITFDCPDLIKKAKDFADRHFLPVDFFAEISRSLLEAPASADGVLKTVLRKALDYVRKSPERPPADIIGEAAENLLLVSIDEPFLRNACLQVFQRALNRDNVVTALLLAQNFQCKDFKNHCLARIKHFKSQGQLDDAEIDSLVEYPELFKDAELCKTGQEASDEQEQEGKKGKKGKHGKKREITVAR